MVTPQMERLERHLTRLRLSGTRIRLDALLEAGARAEMSFLDFLDHVVQEEVAGRDAKRVRIRTQMAKFPLDRKLEDYDFSLQPGLDRRLVTELESGRYLANATNVLLLGPPGVGKTHLAIGLGRKAIEQGYTCRFIQTSDLIHQLAKAEEMGALEEALTRFARPHCRGPIQLSFVHMN